jgi:seryl-tRNA synthetase
MLKVIRENPESVKQNIINKNESANVDPILELDEKRRAIIQEADQLKNQRNVVSKEISQLKKNKEDASDKIVAMKEVSDRIKRLDEELKQTEEKMEELLLGIPNMLHLSVPIGKTVEDNIEIRRWGTPGKAEKNHIELAASLGILDFERASKISGSGFAAYVGKGATLERALLSFMLDMHIMDHGYTEVFTPMIVNKKAMMGTGQIPKLADDMYHVEKDDFYLIPTSEVPITNFYANEMLKPELLPIKLTGYSACFRREAGSYGKDTRGLLRLHQFNKVEMVKFSLPEDSYKELELLVSDAESILKALGLPYRVILLCSGDTSFSSAKTYDIEVWSPAEENWLEVSSCSNFEAFQAKRANIRFKRTPQDKPEFVHTLNGSGLATSRLMVAILEHYQTPEGKVNIPEPLKPYCKFDVID